MSLSETRPDAQVAIIQPLVLHYRTDFYAGLNNAVPVDVYAYEGVSKISDQSMAPACGVKVRPLRAIQIGNLAAYNPFPLFRRQYSILVLTGTLRQPTTWLLLLLKRIIRKKIILWGHGISIRRYINHERRMPLAYKLLYKMADAAWFYTENERAMWNRILPKLRSVSLSNTISGVERILGTDLSGQRETLKAKYGIATTRNLIFCARFSGPHRRTDLLINVMKSLNAKRFGLIVIGSGDDKPDFSTFSNVYDFGAVYDETTKQELFAIADIYFQPAWLGLSAVEAMAYGKPVFTFERSADVPQCVEYGYVESGVNGYAARDAADMVQRLTSISDGEIASLGANARSYAAKNLKMDHMVDSALGILREVSDDRAA